MRIQRGTSPGVLFCGADPLLIGESCNGFSAAGIEAAQILRGRGPQRKKPGPGCWLRAGRRGRRRVELALHLYADRKYGYFVDELYYLDCARHLAWGYVDQPPLIAAWRGWSATVLGDSLSAIRFLPALSAAANVLTGLLARELGGRRLAQGLAALCILLAPGFLALDHFLSMNTFEPLFWMGCAYLLIRMVRTGNPKLWLWFGVVAGWAFENKYSMAIFGFGLLVGLLLTEQRRLLRPSGSGSAARWPS